MEPWADRLAAAANPGIVRASFFDAVPSSVFAQMKADDPSFPDPEQDPHIWLSPQLAEYYVEDIRRKALGSRPGKRIRIPGKCGSI